MGSKTRNIAWWAFAVIFTISLAVYQRLTGPTYPVRGNAEIGQNEISYKLLRSNDSDQPAIIKIHHVTSDISGHIRYRRFNTDESWQKVLFTYIPDDKHLEAPLPPEPPAGKLEYHVLLTYSGNEYQLNEEPVIIRFKGPVPDFVLIPHVLFMFLAMLFSTRTGIEALRKGNQTYIFTLLTLIFLFIGGLILGPVVQKYAFGAFWTGWPFGQDLTDNKTLIAFVMWLIAFIKVRKNRNHRTLIVVASITLLAVYLIPHSLFGSELDYSSGEIKTGQ